ncbi:tyrosine-type recombinase/integrase [Paenibacillus tyrfis]|uniref:tyrosine-type recombinase/integrase n=1 Tax=Paenibacillus tyrfis TaxID=1501230 RepID=UPI0020A13785|nr:site-specific integrase [Paenibacillus tyrfis]MCP1311907.1 site-specific integrase [Paenibacillus tyrfis]
MEINELNSSHMPQNDLWKGTELFLWNASSTEEFINGIKNPHDEHLTTDAIWDVSKSKVRNIMDTLFNYDYNDSTAAPHPKRNISDWLWEQVIQPNIKLDKVKLILKWIQTSKTPITLYNFYEVAMEFQQRISTYIKKPVWQLNDQDITKMNFQYCLKYVNSALEKSFLLQFAKFYFPGEKYNIVKQSKKTRTKLGDHELHPYLKAFNDQLKSEGCTIGHTKDVNRAVMLFLNWLVDNHASFNEFSANSIPVWLIERDHILEFENHLKRCHSKGLYSEITVSNKFYCVITFFKYLYDNRIIPKNIGSIRGISAERYLHRDIPSKDQLSDFFSIIASYSDDPEYDTAFFGSLLHLGLRFCEAERLNWDDINFQARIIKIRGKGKAGKPVPLHLPGKLYQYLEALYKVRSDEQAVFKGNQSKRVFYGKMLNKYKLYSLISGWTFPGGLHLFRHTFITKLSLRKNVHPQIIKRLARHDRLETTSKYLHRQDQELKNALQKIDSIWR